MFWIGIITRIIFVQNCHHPIDVMLELTELGFVQDFVGDLAGGIQAFDESAIGALGVVAQPVFPGFHGFEYVFGCIEAQRRLLESEGVVFKDDGRDDLNISQM